MKLRAIAEDEAALAVEAAMEGYVALMNEDDKNRDEPLLTYVNTDGLETTPDEEGFELATTAAVVEGAWVLGPLVAGAYDANTEVEVWLQVSGMSPAGEQALGAAITEKLDEQANSVYAIGAIRRVRVRASAYPPAAGTPVIQVELG